LQQPQREREHEARVAAVSFVAQHAPSCQRAARCLRLAPRTLAYWRRRSARGELTAQLRGRPVREPTREERGAVTAILEEAGPTIGVPALRACYPEASRCVLSYLVRSYRQQFQMEHRQVVETLRWQRPGSVWAIDHSEPPRLIDGCYTRIFAVRDLASGMQLAWTPVADATATEALPVLEGLALTHGPPLVLKSDNGSAFISADFAAWMERWQIVSLLSPVRMPRYNGACEAGIGAAKRRTEIVAARAGREDHWSADDLYAAQLWANEASYPGGFAAGTPAERFAQRTAIVPNERDTFRALVLQYERQHNEHACTAGDTLTDTLLALHHRRAVRQALVELGYLDITRRSIPQPIHAAKCARIK
jgi:transposase InsO family protein